MDRGLRAFWDAQLGAERAAEPRRGAAEPRRGAADLQREVAGRGSSDTAAGATAGPSGGALATAARQDHELQSALRVLQRSRVEVLHPYPYPYPKPYP